VGCEEVRGAHASGVEVRKVARVVARRSPVFGARFARRQVGRKDVDLLARRVCRDGLAADAEALLGPEPSSMGFVKNLFWGNLRQELVFPYPQVSSDEKATCDKLLADLDQYLRSEHPAVQIDHEQQIPDWVIKRLFEIGVLGMTIPREHGGLGLGITSYNRVLERIGRYCGSTAVLVSAHQSIGCKAIMLFGTDEQKKRWLPHLAKDWLSAFCLSEPNVGCDAGGQETHCEWNEAEQCYLLNGEKKWATSGALSQIFTVMAKQKIKDKKSGREIEKVTALVCTPDMKGIDIFQKNRSKMSIRGTWQARIKFTNARVPKENLLHQEGKGLNVALSCLNYGRCTLSAGMLGGARGPVHEPGLEAARAQPLREREAGAAARVAEIETALGSLRIEAAEADSRATGTRERAHAHELDIRRTEQQVELNRQQIAAFGSRIVDIDRELETLTARREPQRVELDTRRVAAAEADQGRDQAASRLAVEQEAHQGAAAGAVAFQVPSRCWACFSPLSLHLALGLCSA
jgi:alkylation response protein AidB-like acyl-CoA dehydrogenase